MTDNAIEIEADGSSVTSSDLKIYSYSGNVSDTSTDEISIVDALTIVDGLCGICRRVVRTFEESILENHTLRGHRSVAELRISARKGCALCTLVLSDTLNYDNVTSLLESEKDEDEKRSDTVLLDNHGSAMQASSACNGDNPDRKFLIRIYPRDNMTIEVFVGGDDLYSEIVFSQLPTEG